MLVLSDCAARPSPSNGRGACTGPATAKGEVSLLRLGRLAYPAALRLMESTRFDAAMVDYQLPDGSGLDLCAKLVYRVPEIPVIVMSGACDPTLPARAVATGAFSFLKKPFHPESAARLFEQAFG